jgi:hypothetical protein
MSENYSQMELSGQLECYEGVCESVVLDVTQINCQIEILYR